MADQDYDISGIDVQENPPKKQVSNQAVANSFWSNPSSSQQPAPTPKNKKSAAPVQSNEAIANSFWSNDVKKKADGNASATSAVQPSLIQSKLGLPSNSQNGQNNNQQTGFQSDSLLNFPEQKTTDSDFSPIEKKKLENVAPLGVAPSENRNAAINTIVKLRSNPAVQRNDAQAFIANDLNSQNQATDKMTNAQRIWGTDMHPMALQKQMLEGDKGVGINDNLNVNRYFQTRKAELNSQKDDLKEQQYVDVPTIGGGDFTTGMAYNTSKEKAKNFDELQAKIDNLDNYINAFDKYTYILTANQKAKNTPLPANQTPAEMDKYYREIGLGVNGVDDPDTAEKKKGYILSGEEATRHPEVVDRENYRLAAMGLNAKQYSIETDFAAGDINKDEYVSQTNEVQAQRAKLFDLHPEAKKASQFQALGQILNKNRQEKTNTLSGIDAAVSLFHNIVNYGYTDDEVAAAAKELGYSDKETQDAINQKSDIPGTAFIPNFLNKSVGAFANNVIFKGMSLLANGRLPTDAEQEYQEYDANKGYQRAPEQEFEQPETIVDTQKKTVDKDKNSPTYGKLIDNDNYLHEVANPMAGQHNWGYGVLNRIGDVAGGLGELWMETELGGEVAEAGLGKVIGGGTKAVNEVGTGFKEVNSLTASQRSLLGNYAAAYMQGYGGYKNLAKTYLPGDEYAQEMAAHTMTLVQALTFGAIPGASPQSLIGKVFGEGDQQAMKSFAEMIPKDGIQSLSQSKWTKFLKDNLAKDIIKEGLTSNTKATALMTVNQLADLGVQTMYAPKSVDQLNAGHEILNEGVKNFLTFAPISFFGAAVSKLSTPHVDQSTLEKQAIFRMGADPLQYQDFVNQQVKDGKVSQLDANKRIQLVNSMNNVITSGSIPEFLSRTEKIDYANNILWKNKLGEDIERLKKGDTDNPEIAKKEEQIKSLIQKNQDIYDNSTGQDKTSNGTPIIRPKEEKKEPQKKDEISRETLLEQGKQAILTVTGDNYALKPLKDAAEKDPSEFEKYFINLTRQLQDPNSRESALASYPKEITDIADQYGKTLPENTKQEIDDKIPSYDQAVLPTLQKIEKKQPINEDELEISRNHLYDLLDKVDKSDYSKEEKESMNALIEPLITKIESYDNRTKTETRTVTEKVPVEVPRNAPKREIKPALAQSEGSHVTITNPNGTNASGILRIEDGNYVVHNENGEKVAALGEKAINDRDLKLPSEEEMENPIQFDDKGEVKSVTLKTRNGSLVTVENPQKALDLAIQLRADAIGEAPEAKFETVYKKIQKQISEEVPVKEISSPNIKTKQNESSNRENEDETQKSKERERETDRDKGKESDNVEGNDAESKDKQRNANGKVQGQEDASQRDGDVLKDKEGGKEKPPKPPSSSKTKEDETEEEYTHINKKNITDAKELANANPLQGGVVTWKESVNAAIDGLSKDAKEGESLADVANRKIAEWGIKIDKELQEKGKSTFNPTDEDLAVMSYYRTLLNERLSNLKDRLNSDDDAIRLNALREAAEIQDKILGVDHVLSESGKVAGRSFYIRQMVAKMDADNNLQVRRMNIMRAQNGDPLSSDQEAAIAKVVAEEAKLYKEADTNIPKYSQEDFDKKVKEEVDRITKEKQKNKGKSNESKQEKTLKQTGDEWAAKILKAQIKLGGEGTLQSNILGLPIAVYNTLVKGISLAVKGGATIAQAIKEAAEKHNISESDLTKHLLGSIDRADIIDKIKELSNKEKTDNLTKEAVGKGLINDLVNTHIESGLRGKDVFNEINKDLKEVFPNITEQQVRNAYLKEGEFKLEKKEQINKDKTEAEAQLKNIAKLEKKLEEVRKGQAGNKSISEKRKLSDQEKDLQKQIDKELNKQSIKLERSPKEEVEIKKKVSESHNDRMDNLIQSIDSKLKDEKLSDEDKTALKDLKNTATLSKVKTDTAEKIDNVLDKSADALRKAAVDITGHEDILKEVSQSITDLKKDSNNATQDILLQRHKNNLENKIKEANRKIEANEFEEKPETIRTKSDAESIRLEIETRKIEAKYRRLQDLAEQNAKTKWEKGLGLAQTAYVQSLIGGLKTGGVVLSSAITKQPLNTLTNFTFGNIAHLLNPTLSKAAGAEAPFSLRQEINRYKAHYAAIGEEGMKRMFQKSETKLNEANNNYDAIQEKLDKEKKGTPEYKKLENQLKDAKNKKTQALISHQSNFLFKWIGSNAWKDSGDVLLKGAAQLDTLLGHQQQVGWHDMTNVEKTEMVISMMGSLHGYFKNFSARAEFAAAFTARLENKAERGVDISAPDEILRTANESFVNFLMGKYQEDNYATTAMNRFSRVLEEIGNEPSKHGVDRTPPKNQLVGKLASTAFKGKYPILRTGVNIGREAIVEYLLGATVGSTLHAREITKGLFKGIKSGEPLIQSMREQISKMSPDKVDLIFRCYRKGGVGLVGIALAAMGFIKFGGFYNQDDYRRKKGELKQGDVEIFGKEYGHKTLVAKAFEHNPATMGALMWANARQVYERKISRGKDKGDIGAAVTDALVSDLKGAANIIPVLNDNFGNPLSNPSLPYGKAAGDIMQYFDTDKRGEPIQRDNSTLWDRFKNNTGFEKFSPIKK